MASDQVKSVAVLPIHPQYVEAIISGVKRVEFRKKSFKKNVQYVVIYSCDPVKKIVGFFKVSGITTGSPSEVWHQFQDVGGIEKQSYQKYYEGCDHAIAIIIEDVVQLDHPISLNDLCETLSPPQNYIYLRKELFVEILKNSVKSSDLLSTNTIA